MIHNYLPLYCVTLLNIYIYIICIICLFECFIVLGKPVVLGLRVPSQPNLGGLFTHSWRRLGIIIPSWEIWHPKPRAFLGGVTMNTRSPAARSGCPFGGMRLEMPLDAVDAIRSRSLRPHRGLGAGTPLQAVLLVTSCHNRKALYLYPLPYPPEPVNLERSLLASETPDLGRINPPPTP